MDSNPVASNMASAARHRRGEKDRAIARALGLTVGPGFDPADLYVELAQLKASMTYRELRLHLASLGEDTVRATLATRVQAGRETLARRSAATAAPPAA